MIYSLAAWVVIFVFVTFVTPYVADFIEGNTNLKPMIKEKCSGYIAEMAKDQIEEEAESYEDSFFLPENIIKEITGFSLYHKRNCFFYYIDFSGNHCILDFPCAEFSFAYIVSSRAK